MSLPLKLTIGALTLGSIGGATYGGIVYFQEKGTPINKLIEKEYEYILLDTSDNKDVTHWTENWKNYKNDNVNKPNDYFVLKDWNALKIRDSSAELRKKCQELSTKKVTNNKDDIYSNVTKYCARSVTVEDESKKNNLVILKTDSDSGDDSAIWKKRHSSVTNLKNYLDKLEVKQSAPSEQDIKNGCTNAKAKSKKENSYREIYEAYLKICTKQAEDTIS